MLSDYLVEFSVVAQQGNISRAAERLNVSQSTLTRHLTILESTLGARLMERSPAGVRLTEDGRFVYEIALQMVSLGDGLVQNLRDWRHGTGGQFSHLIVGGLSGLKATLKAFDTACARLSNHGYDVSLQYLPPYTPLSVEAALGRHEIDVVLTFAALAQQLEGIPGLHQERLLDVPAVAIMERTHPLAGAASLSQRDLKDATFARIVGMKDNAGTAWDEFVRQCEARGFSPLYRTLSYQNMPLHEQSYPESIIVQVDDSLCARFAYEQGYVVMPVVDMSFQVVAIIRDDDQAAVRLLEESKSLL